MRLYITRDGSYAGTQADAGKGFQQVEVPTDKAGLLAYLNEHCTDATPTEEETKPELNQDLEDLRSQVAIAPLPYARKAEILAELKRYQ